MVNDPKQNAGATKHCAAYPQLRSFMKDFKSYTPDNNPTDKVTDVNSAVEFAKTVSKAMNGKSEGQLLRTILAEAERGKREGRLSNADLDNFYNTLSPMIDGAKRKKLKEVIQKLKNI